MLVADGALAGAATGLAGFPFISYGQSDVIRIGHLTPRTGFLGTLGEYAALLEACGFRQIQGMRTDAPLDTVLAIK